MVKPQGGRHDASDGAGKGAVDIQHAQGEVLELVACGAPVDLVLTRIAQMVEDAVAGSRVGIYLTDGERLRIAAGPRVDPRIADRIHGSDADAWLDAPTTPALGVVPIAAEPGERPAGLLALHVDPPRHLDDHEIAVARNGSRLATLAVQRRRMDERLSHVAHHDKLTGAANRVLVEDRLDEGLRHARSHGTAVAVMFLDLDNFKIVNDSLGHVAGDQVLIGFAERLGALLRPGDVVGRFGGDEFVVLLANASSAADARSVAERLLNDLRRPFSIGGSTVFLTVSVGIAISHGGRDSGEVLLRKADSAMYQAKERGRSRIEVYDTGLPERAARRLQLEGDLRRALDADEFQLHWQPKISLDTGRIVCAEALVRWEHPHRGMIQPAEFISVTEELDLISRMGEWVLGEAIRQRTEWESEHGDEAPWSIAVNVSALQLSAPTMVDTVARVLERFAWPPEQLVLELTESVLMDEATDAPGMLGRLRDLGIQLALDDFGTGYSSLSYLHRFPVDQLKLDRAFVGSIDAQGEGSPIARAVINMAHALDITVTAEGVETEAQHAGLHRLGCDWAQGFLFAPPMPAGAFSRLLRSRRRFAPS